jgi:hypothetical protein
VSVVERERANHGDVVSGRAAGARRGGDTIQTDQEVTTMQYLLMLRFPPGDGPQEGTPASRTRCAAERFGARLPAALSA